MCYRVGALGTPGNNIWAVLFIGRISGQFLSLDGYPDSSFHWTDIWTVPFIGRSDVDLSASEFAE